MPQNKLKQKVEGLTNIVKQLIKEVQTNANIAQGTLTALQMHIGKDEWGKLVEELKNVEERRTKKLEQDGKLQEVIAEFKAQKQKDNEELSVLRELKNSVKMDLVDSLTSHEKKREMLLRRLFPLNLMFLIIILRLFQVCIKK